LFAFLFDLFYGLEKSVFLGLETPSNGLKHCYNWTNVY